MTTAEYLAELTRRLRVLPENDARDALDYYEGYLNDAGNDALEAMAQLGTPAEVAAQILASYAMRPVDKQAAAETPAEKPRERGLSLAWGIILAVFAVPIGLPVAIAVAAVAFALLVVLLAVIFSIGVSGAALLLSGVVYAVAGPFILPQSLAMGLAVLGMGLAGAGFGILLLKATAVLYSFGLHGITGLVGKTILRGRSK